MKLLFLTPQPPYPPEQGAALRNWGLIQELASRHEVHLLTFADSTPVTPAITRITTVAPPHRPTSHRLRDLLLTPTPDMARRLWSPTFAETLARLLAEERFDAVQVEGIEMVPYALPYLNRPNRPLFIYDAHNAEADLQATAFHADRRNPRRLPHALYSAIQTLKLRRYEAQILRGFDIVSAVSEADAAFLEKLSGVKPLVVPNGINSQQVTPDSAAPAPDMLARQGVHLVFTGKLDFRPNVDALLWFTEAILPRITGAHGTPTLWAVGQQPHAALTPLRTHPQVVLTGRVPAVEPYIAGADVVVVPLRMGSGTRLKVLQALSMAKPMVSTTLGCGGLGLRHEEQVLMADDPATFAAAISTLLESPARGQQMAAAGRRHVQQYFDWRVLVPRLEAAIQTRLSL